LIINVRSSHADSDTPLAHSLLFTIEPRKPTSVILLEPHDRQYQDHLRQSRNATSRRGRSNRGQVSCASELIDSWHSSRTRSRLSFSEPNVHPYIAIGIDEFTLEGQQCHYTPAAVRRLSHAAAFLATPGEAGSSLDAALARQTRSCNQRARIKSFYSSCPPPPLG